MPHVEPSWPHLGPSWGYLGALLGPLGAILGSTVGGLSFLVGPQGGENARDILHFSHVGDILPYLVAHLTHLELSSAHLGPTWLILARLKANLEPSWPHLGPPREPWTLEKQ